MMRGLIFVCGVALLLFSAAAQPNNKRPSVTSSERIQFASGDRVFLKDSFGEVRIDGWDRDEVEIVVTRSRQKDSSAVDQTSEMRQLEKIKVVAKKDANGDLLIETKNLPFMKNNLSLLYQIKVPQHTQLRVKHGIGEVEIKNVIGSINATCSIGELNLALPAQEQYDVDMRAKIGDVSSEFSSEAQRQKLLGAKLLENANNSEPHKLFLRVGIGGIDVKKLSK